MPLNQFFRSEPALSIDRANLGDLDTVASNAERLAGLHGIHDSR
ncbi:hypothetical protein NRB20_54310 [Nocardia sp. RB20]|uniref:Uncharacterized protein n=1 Tax=Nocardia macrotermitis TaxID=2585198 RepID=A0A7K0D968_9NOCA|nr:hypothetical protein [Nocardia macrotermitis]